jgi:hypothetical protein
MRRTMKVEIDCDVEFNDHGELEVYIFFGDVEVESPFLFKLNDILKQNIDSFAVPNSPPYVRVSDKNAKETHNIIITTLRDGVEYADKLFKEFLKNDKPSVPRYLSGKN